MGLWLLCYVQGRAESAVNQHVCTDRYKWRISYSNTKQNHLHGYSAQDEVMLSRCAVAFHYSNLLYPIYTLWLVSIVCLVLQAPYTYTQRLWYKQNSDDITGVIFWVFKLVTKKWKNILIHTYLSIIIMILKEKKTYGTLAHLLASWSAAWPTSLLEQWKL